MHIYIPGSWVFVQIFVTKHFWEYQLVQHTFDDQSFTNSLNHIYPYEFGCKGVNLIWFYLMFYDHFSVRSLLAKLGRWWGWLDPRRCCSTFLDLNWWIAFCMPWYNFLIMAHHEEPAVLWAPLPFIRTPSRSRVYLCPFRGECKGVKTYANKGLVLGRLSVRSSDISGDNYIQRQCPVLGLTFSILYNDATQTCASNFTILLQFEQYSLADISTCIFIHTKYWKLVYVITAGLFSYICNNIQSIT